MFFISPPQPPNELTGKLWTPLSSWWAASCQELCLPRTGTLRRAAPNIGGCGGIFAVDLIKIQPFTQWARSKPVVYLKSWVFLRVFFCVFLELIIPRKWCWCCFWCANNGFFFSPNLRCSKEFYILGVNSGGSRVYNFRKKLEKGGAETSPGVTAALVCEVIN